MGAYRFPKENPVSAANLQLVQPPYKETQTIVIGSRLKMGVPLGTIACGTGQTSLQALCALIVFLRQYPWVVPCLAASEDVAALHYVARLIPTLKDRIVVCNLPRGCKALPPQLIVRQVKRRITPDPSSLATYVVNRVGSNELQELLIEQFYLALTDDLSGLTRSVATCSRVFSRFGNLTARDWRAMARLACRLCGSGETQISQASRISFKTALRHTHRYLGMSLDTAAKRVGWEWVLERVLRREWYVSEGH